MDPFPHLPEPTAQAVLVLTGATADRKPVSEGALCSAQVDPFVVAMMMPPLVASPTPHPWVASTIATLSRTSTEEGTVTLLQVAPEPLDLIKATLALADPLIHACAAPRRTASP